MGSVQWVVFGGQCIVGSLLWSIEVPDVSLCKKVREVNEPWRKKGPAGDRKSHLLSHSEGNVETCFVLFFRSIFNRL